MNSADSVQRRPYSFSRLEVMLLVKESSAPLLDISMRCQPLGHALEIDIELELEQRQILGRATPHLFIYLFIYLSLHLRFFFYMKRHLCQGC